MSRPQVQVRGARQLRSAAKRAGVELDDLRDAHAAAARVVVAAAGSVVPHRSGRLAATVRGSGTKTAAIVRAGGAAVPYAGAIHWGWPRRNIAPSLYLTGPATDTEPTWVPIYEAATQRVLDRIASAADGTGD